MTLAIVRHDDMAPQPWKNGGGITRDLLAWPDAANWQLRISVAEVARGGPFSAYPGVQRWFAVVQGAGVLLQLPSGAKKLNTDSEPLCFDGADAPGCELVAGATLDLNLMAQQDAGSAHMARALPGVAWVDAAPLRALFSARPADLIVDGRLVASLPAMSLAWTATATGRTWTLGPDSRAPAAWWLSYTPRR
jgi:uncharacterized protein